MKEEETRIESMKSKLQDLTTQHDEMEVKRKKAEAEAIESAQKERELAEARLNQERKKLEKLCKEMEELNKKKEQLDINNILSQKEVVMEKVKIKLAGEEKIYILRFQLVRRYLKKIIKL